MTSEGNGHRRLDTALEFERGRIEHAYTHRMETPTIEFLSDERGSVGTAGGLGQADIVVWDNFWPSPEQLRADALSRSFEFLHSQGGFAFRSAEPDAAQVRQALNLIVPIDAELASARVESRFVAETAEDEALTRQKIWVHYDEWIRIGLLYLSNTNAVGGTDFFRHRASGHSSIRAISSSNERDLVLGDSTRSEAWDLLEHVEIRFNRLVLFRPHFFHQATCYFGSSVFDARLNQVFTFHPIQDGPD